MGLLSFFKQLFSDEEKRQKEEAERAESMRLLTKYYEDFNNKIDSVTEPNGEGYYECQGAKVPLNIAVEAYDGEGEQYSYGKSFEGHMFVLYLQCTANLGTHYIVFEFLQKDKNKIQSGRFGHDDDLEPGYDGYFSGRLCFNDKEDIGFEFTAGTIQVSRGPSSEITINGNLEKETDKEDNSSTEKFYFQFTGVPEYIEEV